MNAAKVICSSLRHLFDRTSTQSGVSVVLLSMIGLFALRNVELIAIRSENLAVYLTVLLLRRIAANFHKRFALRSAARDDASYTKGVADLLGPADRDPVELCRCASQERRTIGSAFWT